MSFHFCLDLIVSCLGRFAVAFDVAFSFDIVGVVVVVIGNIVAAGVVVAGSKRLKLLLAEEAVLFLNITFLLLELLVIVLEFGTILAVDSS